MLYTANITHLDIARIVSKLLKFSQNPSLIYNIVAIKAITYLYQTKTFIIKYLEEILKNYIFIRASNTIFKNNRISKKSMKGYLFT